MGCTPRLLQLGMRAVLDESLSGLRWRAALSTAFAGLMRGCEAAIDDAKGESFSPAQHPVVCDVRDLVSSGQRGVPPRMRKRKDLRVLHGKHDTVYLAAGGRYVDAPLCIREWIAARRAAGISPLFCHASGSSIIR